MLCDAMLRYKKGPPVAAAARRGVRRWAPLPNVGRESGTWLHHIESQYEALPERTVFMQARPAPSPPTHPTAGCMPAPAFTPSLPAAC
jgi:hypothetical protein